MIINFDNKKLSPNITVSPAHTLSAILRTIYNIDVIGEEMLRHLYDNRFNLIGKRQSSYKGFYYIREAVSDEEERKRLDVPIKDFKPTILDLQENFLLPLGATFVNIDFGFEFRPTQTRASWKSFLPEMSIFPHIKKQTIERIILELKEHYPLYAEIETTNMQTGEGISERKDKSQPVFNNKKEKVNPKDYITTSIAIIGYNDNSPYSWNENRKPIAGLSHKKIDLSWGKSNPQDNDLEEDNSNIKDKQRELFYVWNPICADYDSLDRNGVYFVDKYNLADESELLKLLHKNSKLKEVFAIEKLR